MGLDMEPDMETETDPAPPVMTGNAAGDVARNGWFVGHFMGDDGDDGDDGDALGAALRTGALEVKWSVYQGGEARDGWGANRTATTLAILVRGRFHLSFPDREVWLEREGDFALWRPNVPHFWHPDGPTVIVTVRWPSVAGDSYPVHETRDERRETRDVSQPRGRRSRRRSRLSSLVSRLRKKW
jgi:hypothetical protein